METFLTAMHSEEKLGADNTGSLKSMAVEGRTVVDGRTNTRFVAYTCTRVHGKVEEDRLSALSK